MTDDTKRLARLRRTSEFTPVSGDDLGNRCQHPCEQRLTCESDQSCPLHCCGRMGRLRWTWYCIRLWWWRI